jgi:hypothetical protein
MQFKVDLFNIGLHVLVNVWLNIDSPLMSVTILLAFLPKSSRDISVDDWLDLNDTLKLKIIK